MYLADKPIANSRRDISIFLKENLNCRREKINSRRGSLTHRRYLIFFLLKNKEHALKIDGIRPQNHDERTDRKSFLYSSRYLGSSGVFAIESNKQVLLRFPEKTLSMRSIKAVNISSTCTYACCRVIKFAQFSPLRIGKVATMRSSEGAKRIVFATPATRVIDYDVTH